VASTFYVTIEGTKQGVFKGESNRENAKEKIPALAFSYEVTSPRDVATGQASGKRQHAPVTFVKEWGAASPQLFQAAVTNEVLKSVLFEFLRTNANGEEEVFETVKLTNATVSHLKDTFDARGENGGHQPAAGADGPTLEEVALTFQKIEIENKSGKTLASDDLQGRVR
jgi:type VI secretion system secreted protein Hcp